MQIKEFYIKKLTEMIAKINSEMKIYERWKQTNSTHTFNYQGSIFYTTYPHDESELTKTSAKPIGNEEKFFVSEKTIQKLLNFTTYPLEKWINILMVYETPLEILIKNKIIDLPYEDLISCITDLNIMTHEEIDNLPSLWYSTDFNNLLKSYLYGLIFNNSAINLSPSFLRENLFISMNEFSVLIRKEIIENFVDQINRSSNPLSFLSVIFSNIRNIKPMYNDEVIPNIVGDFLHSGVSILLPYDISSYNNLQDIITRGNCIKDKNIGRYPYLIICNPHIDLTRDEKGELKSQALAQGAIYHFVTQRNLVLDGKQYRLCSVIIHMGRSHYLTLTQYGEFNDSQFTSSRKLEEFCRLSKYIEKVTNGVIHHPGYLWFYCLDEEGINLEEIKDNIHRNFIDYESILSYKNWLSMFALKEIPNKDINPKWNRDNAKAVYNMIENGDFGRYQYNFNNPPDHANWLRIMDMLIKSEHDPVKKEFIKNLFIKTNTVLPQYEQQSHLTPHTSHLTPHTSHLTPHTSHLEEPGYSQSSQTDNFAFGADDLNEENDIYIYFKRFTIEEINNEYQTKYKPRDTQQIAFEYFRFNKLAYFTFCKSEKINTRLIEATQKFGSTVSQLERQGSSASSAAASSKKEDPFWTDNDGAMKQFVVKIIGSENISKVDFSLGKDDFILDIQKDTNTLPVDMKSEVILTLDHKYFSKQKKYLKYKNKYLQLKRLENNSKYSS
jgi:hypothetical protein